ncbi:hypothetical protein M427DRAFT_476529 [Gonapodya prolifera JEL478]|uniref:Uncharacterized protein n=1 Tax=Gonapodya prolifera (strain JEL478) TaxID=1344416 RepID=A0A139A140_GONPJ|nr:hypothetical protein M427DRAFT_476529 [Gonapodya prolifera JEL478]|eukprot:KXS10444.1 hypothetical protein M427DRAFT_476529 [Gonapodya prolifera JEL478]
MPRKSRWSGRVGWSRALPRSATERWQQSTPLRRRRGGQCTRKRPRRLEALARSSDRMVEFAHWFRGSERGAYCRPKPPRRPAHLSPCRSPHRHPTDGSADLATYFPADLLSGLATDRPMDPLTDLSADILAGLNAHLSTAPAGLPHAGPTADLTHTLPASLPTNHLADFAAYLPDDLFSDVFTDCQMDLLVDLPDLPDNHLPGLASTIPADATSAFASNAVIGGHVALVPPREVPFEVSAPASSSSTAPPVPSGRQVERPALIPRFVTRKGKEGATPTVASSSSVLTTRAAAAPSVVFTFSAPLPVTVAPPPPTGPVPLPLPAEPTGTPTTSPLDGLPVAAPPSPFLRWPGFRMR